MKCISWNVNGIRACINKGFEEFFKKIDADIFCLQETKCSEDQLDMITKSIFDGYHMYFNSAEKKGYSGTAVFAKRKPKNVTYGIGKEEHDKEGRVITLEYDDFFFVCCYTPNSKRELERLDYRMIWEEEMLNFLNILNQIKPVIYCGDLNVAHEEIDLKNPATNHKNAGFTDEERNKMSKLLNSGYVDTFRYLYPNKTDSYSWWSYMRNSREKNVGWRIDYFIVSERIKERIKEATIYSEIYGSDHCPIGLDIEI